MNPATETPKDAARRLAKHQIDRGFKPEALHEYTDALGNPVYWRIRAKQPQTREKWIRPMHWNGQDYVLRDPQFANGKPLYRLHTLANAEAVWFVEGEHCADALEKLGLTATTTGSASSDDSADFSPLAGKTVTLWPDNDLPGQEFMARVEVKLRALGCTVHVVDVAALKLPAKGDCVDWSQAHPNATAADLDGLAIMEAASAAAPIVIAKSLTDIEMRPIDWLWPGYLAAGKLHILGGSPGTGKTTIALALAAVLTTGGRWPDGTHAPVGNVLLWSGEDDPADTLAPRFAASGGDSNRIRVLEGVRDDTGCVLPFDPARDFAKVAGLMQGVKLVIVDPIVSAVTGDSHKNAEVRRGLQPLVDLAIKHGAAVIGITHFTKGTGGRDPLERLTGSLAFGALARVVFAASKDAEHEGEDNRLFVRVKSNIGGDGGGFRYSLAQKPIPGVEGLEGQYVQWGIPIEGSAREILSAAEVQPEADEGGTLKGCVAWLNDLLIDESGEANRRDIMKAASAVGYKERTVHRASKELGVQVQQDGFGKAKRSVWRLPDDSRSANSANNFQSCQRNRLANMDGLGKHGAIGTGSVETEERI